MELTLPRLIIFLIVIGFANDYAMEWQTERELQILRDADLMKLKRQGRLQ